MPHATRAPQVRNFVVLGSPCPPVVPPFKPIVDAREASGPALLRMHLSCLQIWDPAAEVVVKTLNDYNVLLEVRVWLEDERKHVAERFRLREAIFVTLTEAGVEMPYETLQLAPFEMRGKAA